MDKRIVATLIALIGLTLPAGCAAPTPTATPTQPVAAPTPTKATPTPTKAPTATPTKRPLTKTTMTYSSPSLSYLLMYVSQGTGYFRDEGLDMDLFDAGSGTKALAAVVSGESQFGLVSPPDVMAMVAQSQPVQSFTIGGTGQAVDVVIRKDVAAQKGITDKSPVMDRIKALKGLTIGASSAGAGTDYTVRYGLALGGIDPERDVQITYLGTDAARNAALRAGSIDALSTTTTSAYMNILDGIAMMAIAFSGGDVPEVARAAATVVFGRTDKMAAQPEIFEGFARSFLRSSKLVKTQKEEGKQAARKFFPDMDSRLFETLYDAVLPSIPDVPAVTKENFEASLNFRNKIASLEPLNITYDQFHTNKFVEAAKKQLGY